MSKRLMHFGDSLPNEEKVLNFLDSELPPEYKILAALRISDPALGEVEYDAVVLGEMAIYVLEIKKFEGRIRGDARTWELGSDPNCPMTIPSPYSQLGRQCSILVSRLKEFGQKVTVQGFVCLSGDKEPILDFEDSEKHKREVFWYKDAPRFLTDPSAMTFPPTWRHSKILEQHDILLDLIKSGFSKRTVESVPGYTIETDAWKGRRYNAYFASRKNEYPEKVLLKIYNVPPTITDPGEIERFVNELNSRDFSALRKIEQTGNRLTGGADYVLAGEKAFLHPLNRRKYVVVTEWVNGKPLSTLIRARKIPQPNLRCLIASQICRGLAFMHSAGVVHRNLSTENVIWSEEKGQVKIINFDFAKFADDSIPTIENENILAEMQAELVAREKYQAPELRQSVQREEGRASFVYHNATFATDYYALGVILLELFTDFLYVDTKSIKDRADTLSLPDKEAQRIIQTYCSPTAAERMALPLLDAAQIFERQAGVSQKVFDVNDLPTGYRLGIYALEQKFRSSNMSVVYLAENTWTKQKVIIKIPRAPSHENAKNELMRAIRILNEIDPKFTARLYHTDIAFLVGQKLQKEWSSDSREIYYQVWEYIEGKTLKDYLNARRNASLESRLTMAMDALKIVAMLHEKGWIHEDINPTNFMVTPEDALKIIDFGLTRHITEKRGEAAGAPGCFLPPEIRQGQGEPSQPGDVWSLGSIVLVILFGMEICTATGPQMEWQQWQKDIGEELVRALQKATDDKPGNRYFDATEFSVEFERAFTNWLKKKPEMTGMNTNSILSTLNAKLKEANDAGDLSAVESINHDMRAIKDWANSGQKDKCPIDLAIYGIHDEGKAVAPPAVEMLNVSEEVLSPQVAIAKSEAIRADETLSSVPQVSDQASNHIDMSDVALEAADRVQETLRLELEKVRGHMEKQEWREAVALAKSVEERARGALKESARSMLDQAQSGLNNALKKLLEQGNRSRSKNDAEAARKAYQAVLNLDPSNSDARLALMELNGLAQKKVAGKHLNDLRAGMKERKDIRRLGEAVYDAEALDQEGKLPDELVDILKEARAFYDQTRLQMGEETTQMRFGDVKASAEAVEKLQARVAKGEKYIFDATTNTEKPSFELLREAQSLLQQASEDTAQYEINIAEKNKNLRPRYVHQRLTKALEQPFYERDRRMLEEKLAEIDRFVQSQEQAEALQEKALQEDNQVQKLTLLFQAREIFPVLTGLSEQITQVRPVAISVIQTSISDMLRLAESRLHSQEYTEARKITADAEKEASSWPEAQKPEEVVQLLDSARALRQQIDATETAWKEYSALAKDIRQKVVEQDQRATALALFKQVSEEERFKGFPDLRALTSEIDQYKGVGEQLNDALSARTGGDWSRVFEISDKVLKAGTAGKLAPRFVELHADAITELNINRAQELLSSDDIFEANSILSATLNKEKERSQEREANLRSRLAVELERIKQAIEATGKGMKSLYEQACNLLGLLDNVGFKAYTNSSFAVRQARVGADGQVSSPEMRALINRLKISPEESDPTPQELMERAGNLLLTELSRKGISERSKAIKIFRYVGGMETTGEKDWPPYALSLRTAEARRAARLAADSLRKDILEPLKQKRNTYQGREKELSDDLLQEMADQAAILRETSLLETEDERSVGRWVEVQWGRRQALYNEKQTNWRGALEIWHKLDINHPGVLEVKRGLRNARIQHTIGQARYMVENDHKGEDALKLLRELQNEPEMDNAWELNVALAETHALLGQFDSAFSNIEQAVRIVSSMEDDQRGAIGVRLQEKRADIESQRIIYHCYNDAKNKDASGNTAEALRTLQAGIKNPSVKNNASLRQLRDEIFTRASAEKLQKAQEERKKGTDDSKVLAVTALVDLQTLEELIEQPLGSRRSGEELNRLRADLAPAADAITREALDFDPASLPLEQAIGQASSLSARLQTFDTVIPLFTAELEQVKEKLKKRRSDMASVLKNLQTLDATLRQANTQTLWENAVRTGDFLVLEQYQSTIRKLELNTLPDVRAYEKRLEETQEVYNNILQITSEIKKKFSQEEDFAGVKKLLVEGSVQASYRANEQAWQSVHSREYEEIRRLLDDRLRVPDVYGDSDLMGWQRVLEQAEQRANELEIWQNWAKQCEYRMEAASQAFTQAESERDAGIRIRKSNWEKARDAARAALDALTYSEKTGEDTTTTDSHSAHIVGARDSHNIPILSRSRRAKELLEEGKQRKEFADSWLHKAETQISALNDLLERRGFPTQTEFSDAVAQKDWERLEKLLVRAREAGITDEDERKRVDTYARVLEQQRQPKKGGWWPLRK